MELNQCEFGSMVTTYFFIGCSEITQMSGLINRDSKYEAMVGAGRVELPTF